MSMVLPIEIYDLLERKVGKEEAREVGKLLTASLDAIEKKAEAVTLQMKMQIKEELTKELATKADIAEIMGEFKRVDGEFKVLRAEIKGDNRALRLEQKIVLLILISVILLTNPKALELIAKLFGLAK
ncbi:MAG: hypothetical protein HQL01_09860 [Nitrospirae bacterium]|nr:hypothetical protein [Nitrospirota bacterium]